MRGKSSNSNYLVQFIKFGIVGLSNTALSYGIYVGTLFGLKRLGMFLTVDYLIGQILGFLISVLWSFYWNRRYVFTPGEGEQLPWFKALLKTYMSYAFTGLILSPGLSILWVEVLKIPKLWAPLISLLITVPLNFILNKYWAFRTKKQEGKSE